MTSDSKRTAHWDNKRCSDTERLQRSRLFHDPLAAAFTGCLETAQPQSYALPIGPFELEIEK
jgi:hypothetical protein